jgi:hypothetical protein
VTALEAYELTTRGGATDFARLITACESFGPYCLIGGLAVNCYVEPVYTLDADIVVIARSLPQLSRYLQELGDQGSVRRPRVWITPDPSPFAVKSKHEERPWT